MRIHSLTSQYQRLSRLIAEVDTLDASQTELRSHWARYICVLASGFLENAIKEVYSQYARSCSNQAVSDFVELTLNRIQNPKAGRFVETANSFNKNWGSELQVFLDDDGRKEAIDSIMSNRHSIAHGKHSGITLVRIKEYIRKSVEVIEFIENQCGISA